MKIDKNNWCINLKETPEGELKELFKEWFKSKLGNNTIQFILDFYGFNSGLCSYEQNNIITIDQWYNEIYLNGQTALSVETPQTIEEGKLKGFNNRIKSLEDKFEKDLQQLEKRLTKLIEAKFKDVVYFDGRERNGEPIFRIKELTIAEQPKQELPPFPFWVEITNVPEQIGWHREIGDKFLISEISDNPSFLGYYGVSIKNANSILFINPNDCKILHDYKPENEVYIPKDASVKMQIMDGDELKTIHEVKPEEPKPIWETHPDWESCKKYRKRWYVDNIDKVDTLNIPLGIAKPFSETHAKRQVAEIKLMEIAERWNEGVDTNGFLYTVDYIFSGLSSTIITDGLKENHLIYFKSRELCEKSIELHKELWMDYFLINNQNK